MKYLHTPLLSGLAMMVAVLTIGCSDDDSSPTTVDASADGGADGGQATTSTTKGRTTSKETTTKDTSSNLNPTSEPDASATGSDASASDAQTDAGGDVTSSNTTDLQTSGPIYPTVPSVLSLSGCADIGPLCTVVQEAGELTLNCAGVPYTGTVDEEGVVNLTAEPSQNSNGAAVSRSCNGDLSKRGVLTAECTTTVGAVGDIEATTETCSAVSKPPASVLPSVECITLPNELTNVVICAEGAQAGGETLNPGTCNVVQDGCSFQAECQNGQTVTGEIWGEQVWFDQTLKALADAQAPSGGGDPAFLAGESVGHSCSATLEDGALVGECGAGRVGRGGADTSVCSVGGSAAAAAQCDLLAPANEVLFALDSCDPMKYGGEGEPGIGEPLCAFRQNNCVWEIQCGREHVFSGLIEPGATKFEWKLETGTQCEGSFSEAGEFTGVCSVPNLFSCNLWSKEAVPGGDDCPSAPIGETVSGRGCGNATGDAMDCRQVLWHGCDFMAVCSFSILPTVVFAGTASDNDGVGRLDFNGIGEWACYADAPTEDDFASDPYRASNEWLGQCETEEGGQCVNSFDPATGEGLRGLQLYWGEADAPSPIDAGVDAGASDAAVDVDAGDAASSVDAGTDASVGLDAGSASDGSASLDAGLDTAVNSDAALSSDGSVDSGN